MENLAKSTIHALMFFELVEDDVLDPDTALKLSESILAELDNCSSEERSTLFKVRDKLLVQEKKGSNREDVIEFLEDFDNSYFPNY